MGQVSRVIVRGCVVGILSLIHRALLTVSFAEVIEALDVRAGDELGEWGAKSLRSA